MSYNIARYVKTLELDKILELLANDATVSDAAELARALIPSCDFNKTDELLSKTDAAYTFMSRYSAPSFGAVCNVSSALARANAGAVLSMRELLDIAEVLRVIRSLSQWKERNSGVTTTIDNLFYSMSPNKFLEDRITSAIISEDEMSDNASPELYNIRRKIRAAS